jgi:4-hydroxymandelate oxidase
MMNDGTGEGPVEGEYRALHPPARLEVEAQGLLARDIFDFIAGGADDEAAVAWNEAAFRAFRLRPRVLRGGAVDISTEILGVRVAAPILIAPMGLQRLVSDEGELASAAAAARCGVGYVLAMGSSVALESVAEVAGPARWFQVYLLREHDVVEDLIERAERARYGAICITVDVPVRGTRRRDRNNRFAPPEGVTSANFARYEVQGGAQRFVAGIDDRARWEAIDRIRKTTELPIVIKGVLTAGDARTAVDHGAAAVVVSNHGGRQVGRSVAPIDVLEECVAAVAGAAEVYLDGGVRNAPDIAVALALGAKAVLIGRPILWALAGGGQDGVAEYLTGLTAEFETMARLLGRVTVNDFDPSLVRP